jgi:hypothetical protein
MSTTPAVYPQPQLQWIEDRFWVIVIQPQFYKAWEVADGFRERRQWIVRDVEVQKAGQMLE